MSDSEDLLKLQLALTAQKAAIKEKKEDDEGGEGGEGGVSGQGGAVIEMRLFVEMFGLLRIGEKEFGLTEAFDPAAYLAKHQEKNLKGELGHERGNGLKEHPILSKLSKFDGDTPDMSMDPTKNSDAQNRYENKLQLQLGMKHQHQPNMTLKPGGM